MISRKTVTTHDKREIIDITDVVGKEQVSEGLVTIFVSHSTAAIAIMDLDAGTDADFLDFLNSLVPDYEWRHPHDPSHAPDHLLASLIGPSVSVPFEEGQLVLGAWQRIVLVELDGPRERQVALATVTN